MPSQIILPQGTYPVGTRTFSPFNLDQGISRADLTLDGVAMTDPTLRVTISLDISLDNGTTWSSTNRSAATDPFPVTCVMAGGAVDRRTGTQLLLYSLGVKIPAPQSTTRQIRGTLTIAGTSLTTQGTLVIT